MIDKGNPYSISSVGTPKLSMSTKGQEAKLKHDEERLNTAPPELIYPLESMISFMGGAINSLTHIRTLLNVAVNNPASNKKSIVKIQQKIDEMNILSLEVIDELDNLTL